MSLFPAYAHNSKVNREKDDTDDETWLQNSSFVESFCISSEIVNKTTNQLDKSNNDADTSSKALHDGVLVKSKNRSLQIPLQSESEHFQLNKKASREFLHVNTIAWPAAPKYRVYFKFGALDKKHKKRSSTKRYFKMLIDEGNKTGKEMNIDLSDRKDENFTGFFQEEELSKKTAMFNQHVAQYPCDVKIWLEYVNFQDIIHQFEKSYRKGSMVKAQRVLAERKLSILDKALSYNINCELLDRERLNVAVKAFPADELQMFLNNLVERNKGNIILWQGYIEATQCSMSHCTTPAVLNLYTKCLSILHQLRRTTSVEKHILEESILKMLYQCGLFLKQAGLFEQLWTLLKLYLELNLNPIDKNKFNILSGFNEKQLVELEELIFTSQLPLHELWLRTEKLRESCHWLPYLGGASCEDPQRIVFPEDVAELIHPITTNENIFKLIATTFTLLKIPLLPCRHTIMQNLGLDYVPWSLDSIEPLLSLFLPLYPVEIVDENFLKAYKLSVGPQYLKTMPGQEEYLKFILNVMKGCADCLSGTDKLVITIWWFRFQRLLIILDTKKYTKLSDQMKKLIKKNAKDVLKAQENRQNILYYMEYGLLEKELGNIETCITVFNASLQFGEKFSLDVDEWTLSNAMVCLMCRQQVQLILEINPSSLEKQKALLILCEFVLQKKIEKLSEVQIQEAQNEFMRITTKIIQKGFTNLQTHFNFLPDFSTEWVICNAWFLYLQEGIHECSKFMDDILKGLTANNKTLCLQTEILYEFYISILFKHTYGESIRYTFKCLDSTLYQAVEIFPNNLFLLTILARIQTLIHSFGPPWWKVQNLLLKSGRALCALFSVIIMNQHLIYSQEMVVDSITGKLFKFSK